MLVGRSAVCCFLCCYDDSMNCLRTTKIIIPTRRISLRVKEEGSYHSRVEGCKILVVPSVSRQPLAPNKWWMRGRYGKESAWDRCCYSKVETPEWLRSKRQIWLFFLNMRQHPLPIRHFVGKLGRAATRTTRPGVIGHLMLSMSIWQNGWLYILYGQI